jgi:hypothetical protein
MSTTGRGASERVIAAGFDAISLFCDPSPKKCAEGAMNLHRTLHMLQTQTDCQARVAELGRMGFMQWLGGLQGRASFARQAEIALLAAYRFRSSDPAVEVFCSLIEEALVMPPKPLDLALPEKRRRGGARSRRQLI